LLLTLFSHKDSLNEFGFDYLSDRFSIHDVLLGMATILFLSVYIFEFKNLINTGLKISLKYLLYCGLITDILYAIALLVVPVIVVLFGIFSVMFSYVSEPTQTHYGVLIPIFIFNYAYFKWVLGICFGRKIYLKHLKFFMMAVDKLGAVDKSENSATDLRLGEIYDLERIANEPDNDYWPILEILTLT